MTWEDNLFFHSPNSKGCPNGVNQWATWRGVSMTITQSEKLFCTPLYGETMRCDRFFHILQYWHFSNNGILWKLRHVSDWLTPHNIMPHLNICLWLQLQHFSKGGSNQLFCLQVMKYLYHYSTSFATVKHS